MSSSIGIRTLTDGGQPAQEVAREVAEFLGTARRSLDLAQYDFNLGLETKEVVGGALQEAAARGVAVRIVYNVDHAMPIPVPPPPEPDVELIASLGVPERAIAGVPDLMHHKFVVRDGESVWTGSMNWTDDSWSRQENVILTVESPELASVLVRPWFTPGYGEDLSHRIAKAIGRARRVRICSPVITAAPVLATLAQLVSERKLDVTGCLDAPQVEGVVYQWHENGNVAW